MSHAPSLYVCCIVIMRTSTADQTVSCIPKHYHTDVTHSAALVWANCYNSGEGSCVFSVGICVNKEKVNNLSSDDNLLTF